MKRMITLVLMAITLMPASVWAQETETPKALEAYVKADFVSHYMWRGTDMAGICIQPEAGLSWKGLSLVANGNAGINKDDIQEIDITLGYKKWGFNIGVTDYWSSGIDPENRYFFYDEKKGAHLFEGNIGFACKYFSLQAYTMFWGNDFKIDGDRAYSTFVELSIPFRLAGLDWDASVGITPLESAGHTTISTVQGLTGEKQVTESHYFYGEGFTCNMATLRATKNLHFKNIKLPVYAELHTNPYMQKANFLVGISLIAF